MEKVVAEQPFINLTEFIQGIKEDAGEEINGMFRSGI
jgi:hypothetical protein